MRIVFMGSDELACLPLGRLLAREDMDVVAVVSQPDRPKGRGRKPAPCPLKAFAEKRGYVVLCPARIGAPDAVAVLGELAPDVIVVVAYGQYIPSTVCRIPPLGAINMHPSLLPKYRGASPIQWAIANGDTVTGVTILYVAKALDAGDMIHQVTVPIAPDDTSATLQPRLALAGAKLLERTLEELRTGRVPRVPQDEAEATYVKKLEKEDGRIDWSQPAAAIRNRVRGFYPWPGCFCEAPLGSGQSLKVLACTVEEGSGLPGTVLAADKNGPLIAAGYGALRLTRVQPPGKKPMTGAAYLNGHQVKAGDGFG